MGVCNPSCNTGAQIRTYPVPCDLTTSTRKGGISHFILMNCDAIMYSLTNASEWASLVAADDIIVSPAGFGQLAQPETTKEKLTACTPEQMVDQNTTVSWFTKLFDNVTYIDFSTQYDILNKYQNKTVLFYSCDGLLYGDYNWVAGENPGMANISVDVYRESEPDNLQKLNVNFTFPTYGTILKGTALTPSVLSVLFP